MEFWGVEVKPGETVKCEPGEDRFLHLSQAAIGESKAKGVESAPIYVKCNDQKLVLGTLSAENCAQISYDLVFEKEFELFHGSKNASVYFCGYKSYQEEEEMSDDEMFDFDSEEEEDVQIAPNVNGKPKAKAPGGKPAAVKSNVDKEDNAVGKPKAKTGGPIKAEPKADEEDDNSDDEDEDNDEGSDDDEDMLEALGDSDDEDSDDDDDDDDDDDTGSSEEEDESTPKKDFANGKKRPAESATKTPVPEKKAKLVTPAGQKTGGDGKKNAHVATPHPAKQAGKTPANSDKAKQQTPKSSGSVTCNSCKKSFNSENALESHTKAKHSAAK